MWEPRRREALYQLPRQAHQLQGSLRHLLCVPAPDRTTSPGSPCRPSIRPQPATAETAAGGAPGAEGTRGRPLEPSSTVARGVRHKATPRGLPDKPLRGQTHLEKAPEGARCVGYPSAPPSRCSRGFFRPPWIVLHPAALLRARPRPDAVEAAGNRLRCKAARTFMSRD